MMYISMDTKIFRSDNAGVNYFIFYYECITIKYTEKIVNPIIIIVFLN